MKTIGIAGGSGFVGRHLAQMLQKEGYEAIIFSRSKAKTKAGISYAQWNPSKGQLIPLRSPRFMEW